MKLGISVKIDVSKIDKSRLFQGKKGNYLRRYHRFTFNKKVLLKLTNYEYNNLVEWDLARILGMDRIWDCGKMKYTLKCK